MTDPPTELDRLDPAPRRPRVPARRKGDVEKALDRDLKGMPEEYQKGTLAATARMLARQLDSDPPMTPRDAQGHAGQIRQCIVQLHEWAPSPERGDATGDAQAASEGARSLYAVPAQE